MYFFQNQILAWLIAIGLDFHLPPPFHSSWYFVLHIQQLQMQKSSAK